MCTVTEITLTCTSLRFPDGPLSFISVKMYPSCNDAFYLS